MPAKSKSQARFFRAKESEQAKTGHNSTGMNMGKLEEFTSGVKTKKLPEKVSKIKRKK